jgi:predicted nucleotidyltransferase component of viral defense system
MKNTIYYKQVQLLLKLLPIISKERDFALKGGTAINLFFRNMPRLSVDIDLVYLPIADRDASLQGITKNLNAIKQNIVRLLPTTVVNDRDINNTTFLSGLNIQNDGVSVKVEVNTTIRGAVNQTKEISLSEKAAELFEMAVTVKSLSFEDVYAGKICAALDRQHPRDFYDVKLLLENEGISDNLRKTFIVYLISSNRPIVELLNPNRIDIADVFEQEFSGMTNDNVTIDELLKSRENLIEVIQSSLTEDEIQFLLSFKDRNPKWDLLGLDNVEILPSVKWKMMNLAKMSTDKHKDSYNKLSSFLKSLK